ncbi:MAG TPA: hypothetical protein VFG84_03705 [Gemmatimonadaceae bacterium]|nr:hypothetical protein [Gemmatimonadaceae bacterium]
MKRLVLAVAVIAIAACSSQEEAPMTDTAAPAAMAAPEAAATDSTMSMPMDSAATDSTATDSTTM